MYTQVYESSYLVNSFNAMDFNTREVIEADERGYISPAPGTKIVFPNPNHVKDRLVDLNTLVLVTGENPLKLMINDNDMYPLYVDANMIKGVEYIRVYSFTVLEGGPFYFEGLSSET